MSDSSLDEVDQAILHHLQEDGRRSIIDIADGVLIERDEVALQSESCAVPVTNGLLNTEW